MLGEDLYNELLEIKDEIKLHRTFSVYFDRCFVVSQVVAKHNFFLIFWTAWYVQVSYKEKSTGKNEVTRNISSSEAEKFKGYEMIRQDLTHKERVDTAPINLVCELLFIKNAPVSCSITNQIY